MIVTRNGTDPQVLNHLSTIMDGATGNVKITTTEHLAL